VTRDRERRTLDAFRSHPSAAQAWAELGPLDYEPEIPGEPESGALTWPDYPSAQTTGAYGYPAFAYFGGAAITWPERPTTTSGAYDGPTT
jgi:hypothetical protein